VLIAPSAGSGWDSRHKTHFSVFPLSGDNGDNIFEFTLQRWLFEASSTGYAAAMETISLGAAAPIAPEKSAPTAAA